VIDEVNEQKVREFVEMLAVPEPADPPPCPICGESHRLETQCGPSSRDDRDLAASGRRGDSP
jgi:hypothetical protein